MGLIGQHFASSPSGALAYYVGAPIGTHLVELDRAGKARLLDRDPQAYDGVSLSPDGTRIATSFGEAPIRDIWVFAIARRNSIRVTFNGDNDYAVWSPDGRRVAFAENQAGTYDVLARAVDGSGAVDTLASGDPYQFPGGWTPDGRSFVYRQNDAKTNEDLYAVSLDGHRTIRTLNASPFTEIEPALSPDGQWLAYVSDETGRRECTCDP